MRRSLWIILGALIAAFGAPNVHADDIYTLNFAPGTTNEMQWTIDAPSSTDITGNNTFTTGISDVTIGANIFTILGCPVVPVSGIEIFATGSLANQIYTETGSCATQLKTSTSITGVGVYSITNALGTGTLTIATTPDSGSGSLTLIGVALLGVMIRKRIA